MEGKSGFRFCSPALCGGGRMRPCPALAASARVLRLLSETQGLPSRPPLDPRPDAPALSSSPSVLPRLDPAWFPTQGPRLAPGTTVTGPSACVPSQERPGAGERERESAGAKRVDSKRLLPRGHRRRGAWTAATPGRWGGAARGRAPPATAGPRHREEPPREARDLGRLLYKPKEMYT